MDIKKDIHSRNDIDNFIRLFYERVKADKTIGIIFNEIVAINWEKHIPLITDFWETILLDNPVYNHNAMDVHYALNRIYPLRKEHFDAWLNLFNTTLDEMYSGEKASLAKQRALSIALLMQHKMNPEKTNII